MRLGDAVRFGGVLAHHAVALGTGALHRTVGAAALVLDDAGRILLVETGYLNRGWDMPGGHVERGERPEETVQREVEEETGVKVKVGGLALVDAAPRGPWVLIFAAAPVGGSLRPAPGEVHAVEWVEEAALAGLSFHSRTRVLTALGAARSNSVVYLSEPRRRERS